MKYSETDIDIINSGLIRDNFAGTYLVESMGEVALVEVSTAHAVKPILKRLKELQIALESIKYIFVTHIHLDHAGGAGALMEHLPCAKLVLQPSGAKHMIDPSKLIKGAIAVYGEEVVERDYGLIKAVDKARVIECEDGEEFKLGNRVLKTIYTPGHARHHISIYDSMSEGIFTGDSFGLSYPEMTTEKGRFFQPTTTPTAFEYDKMKESMEKMMALKPKRLLFTHYGVIYNVDDAHKQVKKRLDDYIEMVESTKERGEKRIKELESKLGEYYINEARHHNSLLKRDEILNLFDIDIKLNAMGLALWFERKNGL